MSSNYENSEVKDVTIELKHGNVSIGFFNGFLLSRPHGELFYCADGVSRMWREFITLFRISHCEASQNEVELEGMIEE